MRTDRVLFKLTPQAKSAASRLPNKNGLPDGLPRFSRLLERRGLTTGRRMIPERASRLDPGSFRAVGLDRWYVLQIPESADTNIDSLVRELRGLSTVEYAEPVFVATQAATTPNDARFSEQWHHHNTGQTGGTADADIDAPEAWDLETGKSTTLIAVIDGGFDLLHPDLTSNLVTGYDFQDDDGDPHEPTEFGGHGTFTMGLASAQGDNSVGVAGVCWDCSIMPLRAAEDTDDVAAAIVHAADNGADVISISLAYEANWFQAVQDASDYALGQGALVIAASGNYFGYYPWTPAALPNVVAVGATDEFDKWTFSAFGDHLDLAAPGWLVLSTAPGSNYSLFSGTSASTPITAGLAGLLRSRIPGLHVNELRHLLRLGADDQVGDPGQDTPGWDAWSGYGRINARTSILRSAGPWVALDRPHYLCAGDVTVAVKDRNAGATVSVTLTGDVGGDSETVTAFPLTPDGYYEGPISISWAGNDGPVVPGDGTLDMVDGETITATYGVFSTTASMDCRKKVCRSGFYRPVIQGDCDRDGAADPGELWVVDIPLFNGQTELLEDAVATVTTTSPHVEILNDTSAYGDISPYLLGGSLSGDDGMDDPIRLRVHAGAPADGTIDLRVNLSGRGWEPDEAACTADGHTPEWSVPINRDPGTPVQQWTFPNPGNAEGFTHQLSHGTGDLSECSPSSNPWQDLWQSLPVTDRFHSGASALRYGDGVEYPYSQDGAMLTPTLNIPAGGGALGFYLWMATGNDLLHPRLSWHGMVLETKRPAESSWSYLREATYNIDQRYFYCRFFNTDFPFGWNEVVEMFSGDGIGSAIDGDTFDREHTADLSAFADEQVQLRFRFGADNPSQFGSVMSEQGPRQGVWLDTITLYGPWVADSWPGAAPASLGGDPTSCPASFELSWGPVTGAGNYNVYRSELSCAEASASTTPYSTTTGTTFSDGATVEGIEYFYAVEATEASSGCPTERACISGGCLCSPPGDATNVLLGKQGADVLFTWDDPGDPALAWNLYRDGNPDPAGWGAPHAVGVSDEDGGIPGIQQRDAGAAGTAATHFYLVTTVSACGESPLRE